MAERRKKAKEAAGWNPRMVGMVLCAFFALGVMTGFSGVGRTLARHAEKLASSWTAQIQSGSDGRTLAWTGAAIRSLQSAIGIHGAMRDAGDQTARGAIAIVERRDGFYALFVGGELRGPVAPKAQGDLPILSGARVQIARGPELLGYAETMVRSEAGLLSLVSEMNVDDSGVAAMFLDSSQTEILIDLNNSAVEIQRAGEILQRWRGSGRTVAALDMTIPDEAVVRLAAAAVSAPRGGVRKISARMSAGEIYRSRRGFRPREEGRR